MSLCDTCKDPGYCCREIPIVVNRDVLLFAVGTSRDDMLAWAKSYDLPFIPKAPWWSCRVRPENLRKVGAGMSSPYSPNLITERDGTLLAQAWRFRCPHLTATGRCGIYETRPELCRLFEPASDALCVHYSPPKPRPVEPDFMDEMERQNVPG